MFWDTTDFIFDDSHTRKVKALRRKSNYYERKYDDLKDYLSIVNEMIRSMEDTYRVSKGTPRYPNSYVLQYAYYEAKEPMCKKADTLDTVLSSNRDTLKQRTNRAYDVYREYYHKAIREDN